MYSAYPSLNIKSCNAPGIFSRPKKRTSQGPTALQCKYMVFGGMVWYSFFCAAWGARAVMKKKSTLPKYPTFVVLNYEIEN